MANIVSIVAQKGGVGKSTLARHYASVAHQEMGLKVAIIDLDEQKTIIKWGKTRKAKEPALFSPQGGNAEELAEHLGDAIGALEAEDYDLILIDSPGKISALTIAAARNSQFTVIPVGPNRDDLEGVEETVAILRKVKGHQSVIVINKGRHSSKINEMAKKLLDKGFRLPVCPTVVMNRSILADASNDGRTVLEVTLKTSSDKLAAKEIVNSWKWIAKKAGIEKKKAKRRAEK